MLFLNRNKRMFIIIFSIFLGFLLLLPICVIYTNQNAQTGLSVFNSGGIISEFKDTYGIEEFNTSQINKQNPADDFEKATLVLHDVSLNSDFARIFGFLTVISLILAAMVIYVNPLSKFGAVLLFLTPSFPVFLNICASNAVDLINKNKELVSDYFLLTGFDGFHFNSTVFYGIFISAGFVLAVINLFLRKPKKANNESEKLAKLILAACALAAVLSVAFITLFLMIKGIPTINKIGFKNFIFSTEWNPVGETPSFGIENLIITSFAGTFGAILIGVPTGIFAAIFISQIIGKKSAAFLSAVINLLAGIPSVIYGAVGAILLVPFVQKVFNIPTGATLLSAILVLAVMVLPTIVSVTVTSLNAVPATIMEASLSLGLTKEASVFRVLIPAARSGIMTGILLGLGRAIGEAMAIILVAGNAPVFPELLAPARFLTTGIVAEMGYATGLHRDALFAIGLVLFFFILVINSFFKYLIKRADKNYE